ncbi:MAG: N-acetylmuramoyl-L-alanine amidase [Eubacteriales bacterium]|nr:N-acetylmuramoyl-L-alanine amidase [Eubacteriales bacterium]
MKVKIGAVCLAAALTLGGAALLIRPSAPPADLPAPTAVPTPAATVSRELAGLIVALDPGHGGYDGGARAHDSGVWEKELTLQIAEKTERALLSRGATAVMTRREDVALCETGGATLGRKRADLQARVDTAKAADARVFLSIHLNEYRSRRECGPQVFYQRGGDDGRLLAGVLQEALIAGLSPRRERVAMAGDYYVLRSAIPSALVECGFLSNAEEEKLLLSHDYQERIAQAIADGLCEYTRLLKRTERREAPPASPAPVPAFTPAPTAADAPHA